MQKETTLLNNNLFEDLASKYPDFNITQCVPSEQDFEKIALRYHDYKVNGKEADYISTPWGLARSTKNMYKQIRYFLIAILIGYTELITAYKKELQAKFTKDEIQEIIDTIIKTNINSLSQYASKYAVEKNESLQEASGLTPVQKMQAFNNGTRKENVKACGDEKLINYYNICCSYNLTYAKRQLEIELARRGMQQYIKQSLKELEVNDFTEALASMLTTTSYTTLEQLCTTQGADFAVVCLVFAICLNDQGLITFLKNWLTQKAFININHIKVVLGKALQDPRITQKIATCISNLKKMTTTEDLEEDIEKHEILNPKLWNKDTTLKSEVKDKILEIVKEFENSLAEDNIKFNVKDIILVGSNVNYNYTKDSDLDIHIITDTTSLNCPDNLYPALYSAYRSLFNKNLNIEFYGIPVELYIETEESPRVSNGCYSVSQGKWISEPKIEDIPEYDKEQLNNLVTKWETKYNGLLNKDNLTADNISSFIEQIYELRKEGLASGSEWDVKNLTFKEFRNKGYLDHLKELKNEVRGKELSLESLAEDTEKVKGHKWVNKGKKGTHGEFKTKKEADDQRKAMFANGFHEDYDTIEQYKTKLRQITHYIPMVQKNGLFELYNIPEIEAYTIMSKLNQLPEVEWVQKSQSSFDFNHFTMSGQPRSRYKIYGQLKIK